MADTLMRALSAAAMAAAILAPLQSASAETTVPSVGGPGGAPFVQRCEPGRHVTGFHVRAGDFVDAIGIVCSVWNPASRAMEDPQPPSRLYGGSGGGPDSDQCHASRAITHMEVYPHPGSLRVVSAVEGFCRPILPASDSRSRPLITFGNFSDSSLGQMVRCPDGEVAIGIHGRYGNYLDAIGLICEPRIIDRRAGAVEQQGSVVLPDPQGAEVSDQTGMAPANPAGAEVQDQTGLAPMPDYRLNPSRGAVSLTAGFQPDPHRVVISAGGPINAAGLGGECRGWIKRAPDFRVNWTAGNDGLPLIFSADSQSDTTLVINDAEGNWRCDDDSGENNFNPSIRIEQPASGQYDVWVGVYNGTIGEQQAVLHVSEVMTR